MTSLQPSWCSKKHKTAAKLVSQQSCGSWTFFKSKNFLFRQLICIAAGHLKEKAYVHFKVKNDTVKGKID